MDLYADLLPLFVKEFGFNPTDFIRTPDNTRVASQLKAAVNLEFTAPWSAVQGYGWNS